jgi:hypothetical protein
MQLKIRLVTNPGDQRVDRVAIVMVDAKGNEDPDQMVLEGETVECTVSVAEGAHLIVREAVRPIVYNPETKAAEYLDLTPEDPLAKQKPPPTEAGPKITPATTKSPAGHSTQGR